MSYLKGKDIKTQGDCLVYCFIKRIEVIVNSPGGLLIMNCTETNIKKPDDFAGW